MYNERPTSGFQFLPFVFCCLHNELLTYDLNDLNASISTGKNPVISPNFLVSTICRKVQFPHSFG